MPSWFHRWAKEGLLRDSLRAKLYVYIYIVWNWLPCRAGRSRLQLEVMPERCLSVTQLHQVILYEEQDINKVNHLASLGRKVVDFTLLTINAVDGLLVLCVRVMNIPAVGTRIGQMDWNDLDDIQQRKLPVHALWIFTLEMRLERIEDCSSAQSRSLRRSKRIGKCAIGSIAIAIGFHLY